MAVLALLLAPAPAIADDLEEVEPGEGPPPGFELSPREAIELARGTDEVAGERRAHPDLAPTAYTNGPDRWQVSFTAGGDEVAQVHIADDAASVVEAWTGPQVAWRMARGYEGTFGGKLNAPYVWLPLCAIFLIPFVDPRRPLRMLHLDLLVLLGFGASHFFFNLGEIFWSVPLAYPVLGYLLGRMLWIGFKPRERRERLVPLLPAAALALGVLFLVGFRVALNVTDSRVIDVGYSGVIGADRIADGEGLYGGAFAEDNEHGSTYGPVNYLAYVPLEQLLPWGGSWDDLPAAHAAAIAFDLLTILGLLLLGRRLRAGPEGRTLGLALAFAWASYPYTMFVLVSNANDSLVAMLLVYTLLALTSAPARGALLGLAAATKFAPLALAPLLARGVRAGDGSPSAGAAAASWNGGGGRRRDRLRDVRGPLRDARGPLLFTLAVAAVLAAVVVPFVPGGGLAELYDKTLGYQLGRESPFSVWGQAAALDWVHTVLKVAVAGLALAVAVVPRRRGPLQLAALGAAVLIALQLVASHWFYLYVVWFAPFVFVALFARYRGPARPHAAMPANAVATAEPRAAVPA